MNYLKQNHLALLIIVYLALSPFLWGGQVAPVQPDLGGSASAQTNFTNPLSFQERVGLQTGATTTLSTAWDVAMGTKNATTTIYIERPCFAFKVQTTGTPDGFSVIYFSPVATSSSAGIAVGGWATSTSAEFCN